MGEMILMDWVLKLGFPAALAVFLIWRSEVKNAETVKRLQASEDWIKSTLVKLAGDVTAALKDSTDAWREALDHQARIERLLRNRPCITHDDSTVPESKEHR